MRTEFVGIFVLLIGGICLAQTQTEIRTRPDANSEGSSKVIPSPPQRNFAIDQLPPLITDKLRKNRTYSANPHIQFHVLPNIAMQSPCYTMRTYLFSQEPAGSAPRHTVYMICVPSDKVRLREAEPDLKFQPQ